MTKLWKVTVYGSGYNSPKTYYAESKEEADDIGRRYPDSEPVRYAGNYKDINADYLLELTFRGRTVDEERRQEESWYYKRMVEISKELSC